jgi:hypothetical protein
MGNWKLQNWDFSTVGQDLPYNLDILEGAEKWWDSSACIQENLDTGALE